MFHELADTLTNRFCRLSKMEKEKERLAIAEQRLGQDQAEDGDKMRSFEALWCEGWESPCVETAECEEEDAEAEDG